MTAYEPIFREQAGDGRGRRCDWAVGRKSAAGSEEAISRSCSKKAAGWEAPNLIPGGVPDFKERDDLALAHWYEVQLQFLKVPVHFNACGPGDGTGGEITAADPPRHRFQTEGVFSKETTSGYFQRQRF